MLLVKIRPADPKPWQVEHEIDLNNKIGITFFAKFLLTKLDITPKPLNDFTTHYSGIEGNFTCIDHRA